jgi:hypothetical protein
MQVAVMGLHSGTDVISIGDIQGAQSCHNITNSISAKLDGGDSSSNASLDRYNIRVTSAQLEAGCAK